MLDTSEFFKKLKCSRILISAWCAAGILLVAYGMIEKSNFSFVLGIASVIASYLVIRIKLKAALPEKKPQAGSTRR